MDIGSRLPYMIDLSELPNLEEGCMATHGTDCFEQDRLPKHFKGLRLPSDIDKHIDKVSKFAKLKYLDLTWNSKTWNSIGYIPGSFSNLNKLQILILSSNQITIVDNFPKMGSLNVLLLSRNFFSQLPNDFGTVVIPEKTGFGIYFASSNFTIPRNTIYR